MDGGCLIQGRCSIFVVYTKDGSLLFISKHSQHFVMLSLLRLFGVYFSIARAFIPDSNNLL